MDLQSAFYLSDLEDDEETASIRKEEQLQVLLQPFLSTSDQFSGAQAEWIKYLQERVQELVHARTKLIRAWVDTNLSRFDKDLAHVQGVYKKLEESSVKLMANVKLCGLQCSECHLACISVYRHDGPHNCRTSHRCLCPCDQANDHSQRSIPICGLP